MSVEDSKYNSTAVAVDLDRTTINTDTAIAILIEISRDAYPDFVAELERRRNEPHLDVFDIARRTIGKEVAPSVLQEFSKYIRDQGNGRELLLDGAMDTFRLLKERNIAHFTLTTGRPEWQEPKITGIDILDSVPYVVLGQYDKGYAMRTWRRANGEFHIPAIERPTHGVGYVAIRELVLIDDSQTAFIGLPDEARGYLLEPDQDIFNRAKERHSIPDSVTRVNDLKDVARLIEANEL